MSIYDYWIDGNGVGHKISEMETNYIINCLNQIDKMKNSFGQYDEDDLCLKDMSEIIKVGTKAWFVINAREYENALTLELALRE